MVYSSSSSVWVEKKGAIRPVETQLTGHVFVKKVPRVRLLEQRVVHRSTGSTIRAETGATVAVLQRKKTHCSEYRRAIISTRTVALD